MFTATFTGKGNRIVHGFFFRSSGARAVISDDDLRAYFEANTDFTVSDGAAEPAVAEPEAEPAVPGEEPEGAALTTADLPDAPAKPKRSSSK